MSKAKACEEMILYERPLSSKGGQASPRNTNRKEAASPVKEAAPPQMKALQEFEAALIAYIKDTTLVAQINHFQD